MYAWFKGIEPGRWISMDLVQHSRDKAWPNRIHPAYEIDEFDGLLKTKDTL